MSREAHVRFWERVGVKFPCATRQHRLFCRITQNWRGRPLTDHATIIELIAATSTKTGLKVESALDTRIYEKGIRSPRPRCDVSTSAAMRFIPNGTTRLFPGNQNRSVYRCGRPYARVDEGLE